MAVSTVGEGVFLKEHLLIIASLRSASIFKVGLCTRPTFKVWFNIDDGEKGLVPDRQNTEWQAVRKGSLQHEIFIGENPIVWNDDLIIKVNCREEAIKLKKDEIPYCIFVTFEVAEGFNVDLYTDVSTRIRHRVHISNT